MTNNIQALASELQSHGVPHVIVAAAPSSSGVKFPRAIGSFSLKETHQYGSDATASYVGEHEGTQLMLMVHDIKDNKIKMSLNTASNMIDATVIDLTSVLESQMGSSLEKMLNRPQSWIAH